MMNTLRKSIALAAAVCLTGTAIADDQDAIDYRRHVMSTLGEQLGAIEQIVAKKAPADAFAVHAKIIALAAGQTRLAFEPKVAGGDSKPEVWSNWADFAKRVDAMVAAANELAKAAQEGNIAAVGPKIRTSLDCDGCHKIYMAPAKH
jgi:cytochrome c556